MIVDTRTLITGAAAGGALARSGWPTRCPDGHGTARAARHPPRRLGPRQALFALAVFSGVGSSGRLTGLD